MNNVDKLKSLGAFGVVALQSVRQRLGVDLPQDTSKDEEINEMSPDQILKEYCAWKLGDPTWWTDFMAIYETLSGRTLSIEDEEVDVFGMALDLLSDEHNMLHEDNEELARNYRSLRSKFDELKKD